MDQLVPPMRFGNVNPGIHRGAYPTLRNYRFLSRLQVKTIVSFTPEYPNSDLVSYTQMAGANIVHFQINRTTVLNDALSNALIMAVNVTDIVQC